MDIIKFDDRLYLNFYGMQSLSLPEGWEELHNTLYLENSLSNITSGYFFLNSITQFYQSWFQVKSLGLVNIHGFTRNLFLQIENGLKLANNWTHFCGFFQIEVEQYTDTPPRYYMKFSDHSYALVEENNRVKLPYNSRLKLPPIGLIHDERETIYFPLSINHESSQDLIKQNLYFEIDEILNFADAYLDQSIESDLKPVPSAVFMKGKRILAESTSPIEIPDEVAVEKNKESPVNLADATIIAALTYALEMENEEKFTGNDKIVFKHLAELFPEQKRYLAPGTIDKRLGPGRDELGISKRKKSKKT